MEFHHNSKSDWEQSAQYHCNYRRREHRCTKDKCRVLFQYKTTKGPSLYIDNRGEQYMDIKSFRMGITKERREDEEIAQLCGGKRVFCPQCTNYELSTGKCLKIHTKFFHEQLEYINDIRPIDHRCYQDINTGITRCIDIFERSNNELKPYVDKHGNEYGTIEEYRNMQIKPRNKRNLEKTSSPSPEGQNKKNKHDEEYEELLEGERSQSFNTLMEIFQPPDNINERQTKEEEKPEEESNNIQPDDIFLSQIPPNVSIEHDNDKEEEILINQANENQ